MFRIHSIILIIAFLIIILSGCSLSDVAGFFKPSQGLSVDAEMTIGDKQEDINTDVKIAEEANTITAETVTTNKTEINNGASWWMVGLLILGWILPSPAQMWKHVTALLKVKRS